jgi:hypothetical protein
MSSDLTKPFHDNTHVYKYSFVSISLLIPRHRFCHPCIDQCLLFLIPKYTEQRISPISYIDLVRHSHAVLQLYFINRPKDISLIYEEGQIPSRTLMSLSMIHQVPINQRYGYPFTDNVRMATKYLRTHLVIIVVSCLRAIYTFIIENIL